MKILTKLPSYIPRIDSKVNKHQIVPEWFRFYLDYQTLTKLMFIGGELRHRKEILKRENRDALRLISCDFDLHQKVEEDTKEFLKILTELQKAESFILYKYQDLQQKLLLLTEQVKIMQLYFQNTKGKQEILKQQFYELFRQQLQFKSYIATHLVIMGQLQAEAKYCFKIDILKEDSRILDKLNLKLNSDMNKLHQVLTFYFYPFDPNTCAKNLKKYQNIRINNKPINIYLLGVFVGISTVIIVILLLMRLEGLLDPEDEKLFSPIFPSFRGCALFLIYYWLLALDQYLWIKYNINYQLYLGFNNHFSTLTEVIKRISFFSVIFLILFLITCIDVENYGFNNINQIIKIFPLFIWVLLIGYLCIPTIKSFNGQGRAWLFRMLRGAVFTHFFQYDGRYTFVLDQFVSLLSPIRDLEYTICYYSIDLFSHNKELQHYKQCEQGKSFVSDIVLVTLFGIKCLHCLTSAKRNNKFINTLDMWNFMKNLLAVSVGIIGCLSKFDKTDAIVWICLATIFTIAQYYWEVKNDWLLFQSDSKIRFLRNDLGFVNPYFYYALMIMNIIVISAWSFTISPSMYLYLRIPNQQLFVLVVGVMELSRRFIHNLLKVEKEYILNLRSFKSSKDLIYPYQECKEITVKFRLSNNYNQSLQEFQRLSLDIRRNTYINMNLNDIELLLQQPYNDLLMQNNAIQERVTGYQLQTKKFMKLIEQYQP